MAYVSQELKARLSPAIKAVCKKYGVKATISVRDHRVLVLTVSSGKLDFMGSFLLHAGVPRGHIQVNTYSYASHFAGACRDFLAEVIAAMNDGNHYSSDIQSDYFSVGWYIDINIGKWDKPYELKNV